jgi:hypothetical protein
MSSLSMISSMTLRSLNSNNIEMNIGILHGKPIPLVKVYVEGVKT